MTYCYGEVAYFERCLTNKSPVVLYMIYTCLFVCWSVARIFNFIIIFICFCFVCLFVPFPFYAPFDTFHSYGDVTFTGSKLQTITPSVYMIMNQMRLFGCCPTRRTQCLVASLTDLFCAQNLSYNELYKTHRSTIHNVWCLNVDQGRSDWMS